MDSRLVDLLKGGLKNPEEVPDYLRKKTWPLFESLGIHIVPNHYYYPIPDLSDIKEKKHWNKKFPTKGIDWNEKQQLDLLEELDTYLEEYSSQGSIFEAGLDGPIYYSLIRNHKPERIIEIGSGGSTNLALHASKRNEKEGEKPTHITAIEPYPDESLRNLSARNENIHLIDRKAEEIEMEKFTQLSKDDFLFIDSSHTVTIGSDVTHLYLRVLPYVPDGVLVHIHDIYYPYDFPEYEVMEQQRFWTEQYLLQTFLMYNEAFEVLWAGHYLAQEYPEVCREYENKQMPITNERGGPETKSFYMMKV